MKLFVNDLTVMDFSYLCPERGMVGESWIVDIILDGGLNEESMVQDFGIVKKELKRVIDDYVDHKLVVPADYYGTTIIHNEDHERVSVDFEFSSNHRIHLYCPPEAYAFVYSDKVDKQSVNDYLKEVIAIHLPENVQSVEITLRDEVINTPFYHYTHGLKKHEGNCQRIAHGHRSKVLIYENGKESFALEEAWAKRWADIYIGTQEDIVNLNELSHQLMVNNDDYFAFKYESSQGVFEMAIPKSVCEIISTDSTVECLAQYIYDEIKRDNSNFIEVRAFEGVGKGAIVSDD